MKRILPLFLAAAMLLTACGPDTPTVSDGSEGSVPSSSQSTSQQAGGENSTDTNSDVTDTTGTDTSGTGTTDVGNGDVSTPTNNQGVTPPSGNGGGNGTTTNQPNGNGGGVTTTTTKKPVTTTKPKVQLEASEVAWYQNIVDTENAWLASTQLSNGALPMNPPNNGNGTVKVVPYFSDFAALSLLNQADKYASNVKKYMDWHFANLNTAKKDYNGVDGTIYDYNVTVSNGVVTGQSFVSGSKGSYDSTDSYAATFLMVLQKYVEKTGDKAYIIANAANIERVVNAMFSTMVNGLTLAKPDYRIKYLMDNCEVYEGMLAGAKLYSDVLVPAGAGKAATRDKLQNGAKQIADNIQSKMWTGSYYRPALGEDDASAWKFSWTEYYPSATSQTFLIIHGLLDPNSDRAKTLYNQFCQSFSWETFDTPDTFYWGSNAYTAAMMGDVSRVKTYMEKYAKVAMKNHRYPLYNSDAAKACMAAYLMTQMG